MKISEPCCDLLGLSRDYHHLYQGRFANHLPMALIALDKMGAEAPQLTRFYDTYSRDLEMYPVPGEQAPVTDWAMELGFSDRFHALHRYFEHRIAELGVDGVLAETLPVLLPGFATSGFHAAIRLAYALDAGHHLDIALSLAYWTSEFHGFSLPEGDSGESLEAIVLRLSPHFEGVTFGNGTIVEGMSRASRILTLCEGPFQPANLSLEQIAAFAIDRYAASGDFTLLHLVTGSHAARILLPYVADKPQALAHIWQSVLIGFFSTGLDYHPYELDRPVQSPDWPRILGKVLGSHNDHQIKLVYTCWQEWQQYRNPVYFDVARHVAMV